MNSYLETEMKLYVGDLAEVEARLQQIGAKLQTPRVYERNVRYENAEKTLTQQGIVVRLRQDRRVRLTYKEPVSQSDETVDSRFEAEVEVSDYDAMALILERLGYAPFLVYEKYRTTYTLGSVEIVLDEMPYGNFVEVEGEAPAIKHVVDLLELTSARRFKENYVQLFENVCQNLKLPFHDLTFANFKDVQVPSQAFEFVGSP